MATETGPVPQNCLDAICQVESGKSNKPCAKDPDGSGEISCGYFQIKEKYYNDANEFRPLPKQIYEDCAMDYDCSVECIQNYMSRYATKERLNHDPVCEDFARIHNGGPNGYKDPKTCDYWKKVKKELDKGKSQRAG